MKLPTMTSIAFLVMAFASAEPLASTTASAAKDSSGKIDTLLPGGTCGKSVTILDTTFNDAVNEVYGNWGTFSDSDRTRTSKLPTEGSSTVSLTYVRSVGGSTSGRVSVKAFLDKRTETQWHKSAGWAGVQTGVCGDANQLSGISFHINADTIPSTVAGIRFRVAYMDMRDTASVFLPSSALRVAGGGNYCILPGNLRGLNGVPKTGGLLSNIRLLMWEARIANDTMLSISTAKVDFSISNVRLHDFRQAWVVSTSSNSGCHSGAIEPRLPFESSPVSYRKGLLVFQDLQGVSSMDILGLDGRRVVSFAPAPSIPLRLSRGTWILAVHLRDGSVSTQPFTVFER